MRVARRTTRLGAALGAVAVVLAGCSSTSSPSPSPSPSGGSAAPTPAQSALQTSCPTATSCFVSGNIVTIGGVVPGLFRGGLVGTDAYLAYQNSLGGLDGRKFKLLSADDQLNCDLNRTETEQLVPQVLAFTGNFSLQDKCGAVILAQHPTVPDISATLDATTAALPQTFSPQPLAVGSALGPLALLKQNYPEAMKHIGTIVAALPSSEQSWTGVQAALDHVGAKVVDEQTYSPLAADFTPYVLRMKQEGVQMVLLFLVNETVAARFVQEAHTQNFHPQVIIGASPIYTDTFVNDVGGPSVADGIYLLQPEALYLGGDVKSVPDIALFQKWVTGLYPGFHPDIFTLFGWVSAELYVDALRAAGPHPTQASLMAALRTIHHFDGRGMVAPADPAGKQPPSCYLLAKIVHGQFVRTQMAATGYRCDGSFFQGG